VPIRVTEANDVAKMTDVIPAEYKEYFSTTVKRFSGARVNSNSGDSESELWSSMRTK
jgi:hypothetical protein